MGGEVEEKPKGPQWVRLCERSNGQDEADVHRNFYIQAGRNPKSQKKTKGIRLAFQGNQKDNLSVQASRKLLTFQNH